MDQNPKQIVAEKLRASGSVLIAVSKDPSVDELAAALGLSLMLNALGKHTTAVFSGEIPSTVEFLEPEKLIDSSVDGLRDFIISISKDKADKLRYKVEDDVVKIYITPYQGKIDQNDLEFGQGDLTVDVVVALGVKNNDDLDGAIASHGKILHDATILSITAGDGESKVGSVNWHDENASSISEMLVSISEALQGNLLDGEMATAFLTGIVAATDRFSNDRTTPKVMTMSAQLMAAGANQQLIASNLDLDGVVHPDEQIKFHKEEKKEQDKKNKKNKDKQDKPKKKGDDNKPTLDKVEAAATDDSLSLNQIEQKLHAHESELKKHDDIASDVEAANKQDTATLGPQETAHYQGPHAPEDPAIMELEDEIDHDPQENYHQIEEVLHNNAGQTHASMPPLSSLDVRPKTARPPEPVQQPQPQPVEQPHVPQPLVNPPPGGSAPVDSWLPDAPQPQQPMPQQPMQQAPPQQPPQPQQPMPQIRQQQGQRLPDYDHNQTSAPQPATLDHDPQASHQPKRLYADGNMQEPALQYENNIPSLEHGSSRISNVKGQGPKNVTGDPSLGGTFNATSNEAHKDAEKQLASGQNAAILQHANEQEANMIDQARKEVEAAMGGSQGQQPSGEILIDDTGQLNLNQAPSAPPPLPPNPQMPPPPAEMLQPMPQAQGNAPAPPLPQSPGNVGQMYIPASDNELPPNEAQENPFNLPGPPGQ